MGINIKRICRDLRSDDLDIRMLALNTVLQLSKDNLEEEEPLRELHPLLEEMCGGEDVDETFLAKKGVNHVQDLMVRLKMVPKQAPRENPLANLGAQEVAQRLKASQYPEEVSMLLARAAQLGHQGLMPLVGRYLQTGDARVRANAVEAVGTCARPEVVTALVVPYLADENNRVRANVARVLLALGQPQVLTTLKQMLRSQNVSMRESATYTLASLKGREHAELLVAALADPFAPIRIRAIRGLAQHGFPEAVANLSRMLNDLDIDVSQEADRAIRVLQGKASPPDGQLIDLDQLASSAPPSPIPATSAGGEGTRPRTVTDQRRERREQAQKELEQIEAILKKGSSGVRAVDLQNKGLAEVEGMLFTELVALGKHAVAACRGGDITDSSATRHYYDFLKYDDLLEKRRRKIQEEAEGSGIFQIVKARLGGSKEDDPLRALEERREKSLAALGDATFGIVEARGVEHPDLLAAAGRVRTVRARREELTVANGDSTKEE